MKRGIGWLTASQKNNVLEVVQKVVNVWAQEWLGNSVSPIVHLKDFSAADQVVLQNTGLLCLGSNRSVGIVTENKQQWGRALFTDMAEILPVDTIFDYLLERAQTALLQKFADAVGENNTSLAALSRVKTIDTDGILVIAQINCGNHVLELVFDSSLVVMDGSALLPTATTSRLKSIHDEKIDLSIRFSLNHLGVADLVGLQVGDVIKSKHLISTPFDIVCNEKRLAGCSLGSSHGQLAILLVSR